MIYTMPKKLPRLWGRFTLVKWTGLSWEAKRGKGQREFREQGENREKFAFFVIFAALALTIRSHAQ